MRLSPQLRAQFPDLDEACPEPNPSDTAEFPTDPQGDEDTGQHRTVFPEEV